MALVFKNHVFLFVFIFATACASLTFKANAEEPIPPPPSPDSPVGKFCDPDGDLVICGELIGNAKTWEEAMTSALNAAIKKLSEGQRALDGLEHKIDPAVPQEKKNNIVNVCGDGFDTVMDSLKESLGLVTNDPTLGLNNKVSAAFSGFSQCIDTLTEDENQKGDIGELIALNVFVQQHVYVCMMVANRDPRVKNYFKKVELGVDND